MIKVITIYFCYEKKFWHYLNNSLKSKTRSEHRFKVIIGQTFLSDWRYEPCAPKTFQDYVPLWEENKHRRQAWKNWKCLFSEQLKKGNIFSHVMECANCGDYSVWYQVDYVACLTICHLGKVSRSSRSLDGNLVFITVNYAEQHGRKGFSLKCMWRKKFFASFIRFVCID